MHASLLDKKNGGKPPSEGCFSPLTFHRTTAFRLLARGGPTTYPEACALFICAITSSAPRCGSETSHVWSAIPYPHQHRRLASVLVAAAGKVGRWRVRETSPNSCNCPTKIILPPPPHHPMPTLSPHHGQRNKGADHTPHSRSGSTSPRVGDKLGHRLVRVATRAIN